MVRKANYIYKNPASEIDATREAQLNYSRRVERKLHAAAHRHYEITLANSSQAFSPSLTPIGTKCVAKWTDPRGNAVLQGFPASGEEAFELWDSPSLAAEFHAEAVQDPRQRTLLGSWLYIAGDADRFWSMIAYFHNTGNCMPPHVPRSNNEEADDAALVFTKEMQRVVTSVAGSASGGAAGSSVQVNCHLASVVRAIEQLNSMMRGAPGALAGGLPEPLFQVARSPTAVPLFWETQDSLWTSTLREYIATARAPCQWLLKPSGCLGSTACVDDHTSFPAQVKKAQEIICKPDAEQRKIACLDAQLSMAQRLCSHCHKPSNPPAVELKRCSQCKNLFYCSAQCNKAHWKVHKKNCRAPGTQGIFESVWAVVIPAGDVRKPYAVLIPSNGQSALQYITQQILGVGGEDAPSLLLKRPVRGDDVAGLGVVYDRASKGPPNIRAQTLFWNIGSPMPLSGPAVKVHGPAVVIAVAWVAPELSSPSGCNIVPLTATEPRPRVGSTDTLSDFPLVEYERRWGIFSVIHVPEAAVAQYAAEAEKQGVEKATNLIGHPMGIGTVLPLTVENERLLAESIRIGLGCR